MERIERIERSIITSPYDPRLALLPLFD
jgi:hypothetical protein